MDVMQYWSISAFSFGQYVDEASYVYKEISQNLKIDKNNIKIHGNSNNNMLDVY